MLQKESENRRIKTKSPDLVYWFWKQAGIAAITALGIFFVFVFLHHGQLLFNSDGSFVFNKISAVEVVSTFFYVLAIFLVHRGISTFVNSLRTIPSLLKAAIEAVLVVVSSILLLWLLVFLPFRWIFPEVEIAPGRERLNFVIMSIVALFFYYFVERQRGKRQLQAQMLRTAELQKENFQAQLQTLKNQMNPHFLFNSLNVLGSLVQTNQEKAGEFLERLSEIYRAFLENSEKTLIPLAKELEVAKAYMYLLQTRFGNSIKFKTEIPESEENLLIPPGTIQMLLENAVKHNGFTATKPLLIQAVIEEGYLVVSNKIQPRRGEVASTRIGLENIRNRYKYLTHQEVRVQKSMEVFSIHLPLLKNGK